MGEFLNYIAPNVNNLVENSCFNKSCRVLSPHVGAEDAELAELEACSDEINAAYEAAAAAAEDDGSIREDVFRAIEQKLDEARARFHQRVIRRKRRPTFPGVPA
jgi:hypothetical protein